MTDKTLTDRLQREAGEHYEKASKEGENYPTARETSELLKAIYGMLVAIFYKLP